MELLELKGSGASKLLSNLVQADIIEPVSGYGKGKYKFIKQNCKGQPRKSTVLFKVSKHMNTKLITVSTCIIRHVGIILD